MPGPTLTFAIIVATLFGAGFHFIVGGDARRLILYLLCSWIGFGLGHVAGTILGIDFLSVGTLRTLTATIGALVALVAAYILTLNRTRKRSSR